MRLVAAVVIIVAALVVIALLWWSVGRYLQFRSRRAMRIETLDVAMWDIRHALDRYTPTDLMGENLANDVRFHVTQYHQNHRSFTSPRRALRAAEKARAEITRLTQLCPPHLFSPDDESSRTFLKEVFNALHTNKNEGKPA